MERNKKKGVTKEGVGHWEMGGTRSKEMQSTTGEGREGEGEGEGGGEGGGGGGGEGTRQSCMPVWDITGVVILCCMHFNDMVFYL